MAVKNPKELFVVLLSEVRHSAERSEKIYQEIGQLAQDVQIKQALEARGFVSGKIVATLDECFRLIGEQPAKNSGQLQEVFLTETLKQLGEIQSVSAKKLFILAKLNQFAHVRIGAYRSLLAIADAAGHYGVGVLLETCLADQLAFMERTRRLAGPVIEEKIAAAASA